MCLDCDSTRVAEVSAKVSDRCYIDLNETEEGNILHSHRGPVPCDMNIGEDDYLRIDLCLDCGLVQGEWPLPSCDIEEREIDE